MEWHDITIYACINFVLYNCIILTKVSVKGANKDE